MPVQSKKFSFTELSGTKKAVLIALLFLSVLVLFLFFPPQSVDWIMTFYPVSHIPFDPYGVRSFLNLPWTALILYPLHFFTESISLSINASLSLVIILILVMQKKGNLLSILLTLTSLPFLSMVANGGIEWIPALGFIFQNELGVFLLLTKPQCGLLAGIDWFLRCKNRLLFVGITLAGTIVSLFIWRNWPGQLLSNYAAVRAGLNDWNMSLFPWAIPIGLGLIFYIFYASQKGITKGPDRELLGAFATYCLVPYFAPHSITILFALLSAAYPRLSIAVWLLLWVDPIVQYWSSIAHFLGFR